MPLKASTFIGTSLDGFIARPDGALDFLPDGGGERARLRGLHSLGRCPGDRTKDLRDRLGLDAWAYGDKPVFVLSTGALAPAPKGAIVERMSGESRGDIVAVLESRGIRHVYVDGGITIQRFLAAGLIDRIIITRVPVLIGERHPALWCAAARHTTSPCCDATVSEWPRPERYLIEKIR